MKFKSLSKMGYIGFEIRLFCFNVWAKMSPHLVHFFARSTKEILIGGAKFELQ